MSDAAAGMSASARVEDLTSDQQAEIHQAFSFYDRDGDDKIKPSELGIVIRSLGHGLSFTHETLTQNTRLFFSTSRRELWTAPTEGEVRTFAKEADPENTGMIAWPNFLKLAASLAAHPIDKKERARNAFKVFDSDKDGLVSARELRHCLTTLGDKLPKEDVDEAYREVGITDDAMLDLDSFMKLMGVN